ncbi:hypothetical protein GGH99_002728, partial [Coemansia sp. RSA 1285]
MDTPASYAASALQQRSTPSIPNILAYGVSPPSFSPTPKHLQKQHPQTLISTTSMPSPLQRPSAEAGDSQYGGYLDGQQSTISSEADFGKDDTSQTPGESSARRRNINSSKRAAQNRAAQRAFRLRRERYVAGLEEKARSYDRLEAAYIEMQRENLQLRSRLNKIQSENSILRTHLTAAGTHASSPSPPTASTTALVPRQTSSIVSDRGTQHVGMRPQAPIRPPSESSYQYSGHQQPQYYRAQYPHYHPRHYDHPSAPPPTTFQDNPQLQRGPIHHHPHHHKSTVYRQPSPGGAHQPYHHHRPQQQQQQQQHTIYYHHQVRREHSLPQNSAGSHSPALTEGRLLRPEPMHPTAFASPAERTTSPGGMWDCPAAADRVSSPAVGASLFKMPMSSETAASGSSAAAAHMLPSVRELTMSIGAMLPTSPHVDRAQPAQPQFQVEGTASRQK